MEDGKAHGSSGLSAAMKHAEKIAPVTAALSALATLGCCLPVALAASTATGSLAIVAGDYRWCFLGASAVLLFVGSVQVARLRRSCPTRGTGSIVVLALSAAILLVVAFFPQVVAGLIADWLP
jgi:hypothetical protein